MQGRRACRSAGAPQEVRERAREEQLRPRLHEDAFPGDDACGRESVLELKTVGASPAVKRGQDEGF